MTHTSPTAEDFAAATERAQSFLSDSQFIGADRNIARCFLEQSKRIAALEAELAEAKDNWQSAFRVGADYMQRAEKAEAQLAARLPTEAQISYLLEVLAKEGMANDGGDFMRRKISKAILALLSGVVTPAPTAALTEEDFREVMKALEDLSFECFSPIAPCNPPSVATYNRTFEVLNKHRAARGWKVVPKSTPQGAEE